MPDPRAEVSTTPRQGADAFLTELDHGLAEVEGWLAAADRTALPTPSLPPTPQGVALNADEASRARGVAVRLQDVLAALTELRDQVAGELSTSGERRLAARSYLVHEPRRTH
jgi:hypothetical protein